MRSSDLARLFWLIGILWAVQLTGQEYAISTIAGGIPPPTPAVATTSSIGYPNGVAADSARNIYLSSSNCVFKLDSGGILTRVAGNSRPGYSGDDGAATSAQLSNPFGVAVDGAGNLYIADSGNARIRRVSPSGIITTVAGNGTYGYSGDGGTAVSAQLSSPYGVGVDGAGNLYIADTSNNRIRRVSPSGIITTVAGNGTQGYAGDGGAATSAQLSYPYRVAVDGAGNLYLADSFNHRIRRVSPSGIITTVAGNGTQGYSGDGGAATSAQLSAPQGVEVDGAGNLYIADTSNQRIRRVSPSGIITTVAGNGTYGYSGEDGVATSTPLSGPIDVAVDGTDNLYIADSKNNRIRRVSASGVIRTVAGNGTGGYSGDGGAATLAQLSFAFGVAVDGAGNVYIADTLNNCIRRVSPSGIITTVAGSGTYGFSGDGGHATLAQLSSPNGVAVDSTGNLYIADSFNDRIRRVSASGIITTVAGNGTQGYSGDGGTATSAQLYDPVAVALDGVGNLYIADFNRIRRVSPSGIITTVAGNGTWGYSGDGGAATSAQLSSVFGLAVDAAGNVYIADANNYRIRRVSPSGIITTVAGNGTSGYSGEGGAATSAQLSCPFAVALDGAGNIYIADFNRIRRVSPSGIITTVAGNGIRGYSGDGGAATAAQVYDLYGVALDAAGRVYFSTANAVRVLYSVTPSKQTFAASGGTAEEKVTAASGCPWTAASNASWITISSGVSGSGNGTVNYSVAANTTGASRTGTITAGGQVLTIVQGGTSPTALRFVPVTPCRVVDTRLADGPLGGPPIVGGNSRSFPIPSGACDIPSTAQAYSVNVTVVPFGPLGYLTIWPTGQTMPAVSTLNSLDGRIKANAAILPAGTGGAVSVYASAATHAVLDINGYFVPATDPAGLAFYPVAPCRVLDTRYPDAPLAGPSLKNAQSRNFPLTASACGIPSTAKAYALNLSVVPPGPLGYLTVWPAGAAMPVVSTLNAPTGVVTANAAIIPAGADGAIGVYASAPTDVFADITGYFAPPGPGGLSFYTVAPCRVADTRLALGPLGGPTPWGQRDLPVSSSACELPVTAKAYSFNATVVPPAPLGYLTLWAAGQAMPVASALNSLDGTIVSNAAIVPAQNGSISLYVSAQSDVVLDANGYFAP